MATEKEMNELVGRAVLDVAFRKRLMEDPEQAAQELSFTLTAEQLAALKPADGKGLATVLDERLPKSLGGPIYIE
jgi:hypothetical protein